MRRDGERLIPGLDLPPRPDDRFDDLLGRNADADGRQFRPHGPPLRAHLVARHAGQRRRAEDLRPTSGVAMRASVAQQLADECGIEGEGGVGGLGGGSRRHGGARGGPRAGVAAFERFHEPVEAVQIVAEALLGVVVGVAEDADRPAITAGDDPF